MIQEKKIEITPTARILSWKWMGRHNNGRMRDATADRHIVNVEFNRYDRKIIHVQLSDTSIKEQLFNNQGVLYRSYLWNGDSIREPEKKIYYETGSLQRVFYPYPDKQIVDYYIEGGIQKTHYTEKSNNRGFILRIERR
ncbi:MAG: hypothetical protein IPM74_16905 [Crocinitomicaceae bacterium]|nr:hypothetical protein [Crocinitomicaceae bacterium]